MTHTTNAVRWILGSLALCLATTCALANHRAGKIALPEAIVAGDMNGDGHLDLAVLNTGFDHIAILLGDGAGSFTLAGHAPADTLPNGLAGADLDEDGRLDLVSVNIWGYTAIPLLGDGAGGFSPLTEYLSDEPNSVVLRDFDADGHVDMVVSENGLNRVFFQAGLGDGRFAGPVFTPSVHSPSGLAAGDFDRDGHLDVAITSLSASTVGIHLGDGAGSFPLVREVRVADTAVGVAAGDVDEDGILDLVAGGGRPAQFGMFFSVLKGDGAGGFTVTGTTSLGPGRVKGPLALADLNGDGHLDVAICPSTDVALEVWLFFGDGHGGFGPKQAFPAGAETHTVIVADFDADGHPDLAVSNRSGGSVTILLGDGAGGFTSTGSFDTF